MNQMSTTIYLGSDRRISKNLINGMTNQFNKELQKICSIRMTLSRWWMQGSLRRHSSKRWSRRDKVKRWTCRSPNWIRYWAQWENMVFLPAQSLMMQMPKVTICRVRASWTWWSRSFTLMSNRISLRIILAVTKPAVPIMQSPRLLTIWVSLKGRFCLRVQDRLRSLQPHPIDRETRTSSNFKQTSWL